MTTNGKRIWGVLWRTSLFGMVLVAVAAIGIDWGSSLFTKKEPLSPRDARVNSSVEDNEGDTGSIRPIAVKTVKPRLDPNFTIAVSQPCYVESYFRADLEARVAGPVKRVTKALGERVREGELLVEIDVPDLVEALAQKEQLIVQRKVDVQLANAKAAAVEASVEVALQYIDQKRAEVGKAEADLILRRQELARFVSLRADKAILPAYIEEAESAVLSAEAARKGDLAGANKAIADWKEAQTNSLAAKADIDVKENLVRVASKERDQARAMLELAQIRAPFDGIVVERNVNVGSFVQNSSSGTAVPMMAVARLDMVTVYAKLPDDYADLITPDTQVSIQVDKRPGLVVQGKVTRFAPILEHRDRTMRVEVDLYNASRERYQRFLARTVAENLAPLGGANLGEVLVNSVAARHHWREQTKGDADPFPIYPGVKGERKLDNEYRLMPGMYGRMRFNLHNSTNSYLLPSSTVFTQGGKRFVLIVRDGVARQVPVHVQFDNGNVVKLDLLHNQPGGRGPQEVFEPLTGVEEIVLSGQGEIGDGRTVLSTLVHQ